MGANRLQTVVNHLRRVARPGSVKPSTDAELLARFADERDEAAFAEIVQRHGPLVWAVCRGRLSAADADDAFQATFLVLTRQARRIRNPKSLAGWLAGVARRAAQRAQRQEQRRSAAEKRLKSRPACGEISDLVEQEERARILNEEVLRLPEKYYLPLLLCYFQGLTNEEAGRRLGLPHGTVCGRLSRARDLLRGRLIRRGVTLTAGMLAAGIAAPPGELVAATLAATAKASVGTASVISIAEAVMNAMWMEKVRVWAIGLATAAAIGGGIGGWGFVPGAGQGQTATIAVAHAADPPAKVVEAPAKDDEIEKAGKAVLDGKLDEALKHLHIAVTKRPEIPPATLMLARLMIASKIPDYKSRIRATVEQAIHENPDHPVVYLDNADLALSDGRATDAIFNAEKARELAKGDRWTPTLKKDVEAKVHSILASAYEYRTDWRAARTHLSTLMESDPGSGELKRRFAKTTFFARSPDDAFRELCEASEVDAKLPSPSLTMALLWASQGDDAKAKGWFEKVLKAEPQNHLGYIEFAEWLLGKGEFEPARPLLEAAAKMAPEDPRLKRLRTLADALELKAGPRMPRYFIDAPIRQRFGGT